MCGIAGGTFSDRDVITRMIAALVHRGPDDAGIYIDEQISFGHRRLSIIDLSDHGRQPMTNEDGTVHLVYNGEIYNFRELREDLESRGHIFQSDTDSEVIVHAYEEWGERCVDRFNGMFAFAIWDAPRKRLLLVRDRLGIKPLIYHIAEGRLTFASEPQALLQAPWIDRQVDYQSLYHLIGFEFVPAPATLFEGVTKLPAGHLLTFENGQATIERYWDMDMTPDSRSADEWESLIREELDRSVRSQLVADVPLGVFLSGGLDSSSIVAFMRRHERGPIRTFSLGYADATFSDLEYARLVADAFQTEHEELIIDPITPAMIEAVVWHFGEPMTDLSALPLFLLCRLVRERVKVVLSGDGGDEIMAGYDRFKASRLHRAYSVLPRWLREQVVGPAVLTLRDRPQKKGAVNLLKRFIVGGLLPDDGRHMRWQFFSDPAMEQRLFHNGVAHHIDFDPFAPIRAHRDAVHGHGALAEELYIDTRFTFPESQLMKVDKMSMAHGLEVRVPLLDHRFVELWASIPSRFKLRGFTTKAIFRQALRGVLPERIVRRGKQGYSLPIKNWLRGELREFLHDTLRSSAFIKETFEPGTVRRLLDEHDASTANHSHMLWTLLNVAIWHHTFMESRRDHGAVMPASPVATLT